MNLLFTGGYTEPIKLGSGETIPGKCPGIGVYTLSDAGKLSLLNCTPSTPNPSYLTLNTRGEYLYCVNELKDFHGMPSSTASAYRVCRESGELTLLNSQLTGGTDACYAVVVDKWLLVANYSGGSVCVLPILEDHSLGTASCILRHWGKGVNEARQAEPHPHQLVLSPGGDWVYVSDLGLDRLLCYRFDKAKGYLLPTPQRDITVPAGQGARHFVFGADGTKLYLMSEMGCAVNVFDFCSATGEAALIQTISALPAEAPASLGAAIRLHQSGKYLYCTVRGCNVIAAFNIDDGGKLHLLKLYPSGGQIPRDFCISPDGRYLIVGHQDSDTLCAFSIEESDGALRALCSCAAPCVTVVGVL